jgi:hypothetical protein
MRRGSSNCDLSSERSGLITFNIVLERYLLRHPLACLFRPQRATDIHCSFLLPHGFEHGGFNLCRFFCQTHVRQHHGRGEDCSKGIRLILPCDRRSRTVHRLEHRSAARMNVAAGGHTEASLQAGGEVGDDVAEHIVGDDHIKLARVAHHLHAERIDIHVLRGNFWKLRAHLFENTLP